MALYSAPTSIAQRRMESFLCFSSALLMTSKTTETWASFSRPVAMWRFVHRKVCGIAAIPFHPGDFTEPPITEVVQFLDLLRHIRRVHVNRSKRNNLSGMLFCGLGHHFAMFKRGENASQKIQAA